MKFTVLGASGFIGSHLVARLEQAGHECYAPARDDPEIYVRELGHVIYCIGLTADYLKRPFDTVQAHVSLLARILEKCRFERLVYLSSTRLYDSATNQIARETDDLIFNPANPRHIYDLSKSTGESLCLTASGGKAVVARLSCVYGEQADADGFFAMLLRLALAGKNAQIETSARYQRDYVHVLDVVDLLIRIVTTGRQSIYNVASGVNVDNQALFDVLKRHGVELTPTLDASPPQSPVISIERIRNEFDFQPISVVDTLARIIKRTAP